MVLSLACGNTLHLSAQRLNGMRAGLGSQPAVAMPSRALLSRDSIPPSHWQEGALIGGAVGALVGVLADRIQQGESDDPYRHFNYGGLLISTFLFAVIGGLIGSGIHDR